MDVAVADPCSRPFATFQGRLIGAMVQLEWSLIRGRQGEGIELAMKQCVCKGRKRTHERPVAASSTRGRADEPGQDRPRPCVLGDPPP